MQLLRITFVSWVVAATLSATSIVCGQAGEPPQTLLNSVVFSGASGSDVTYDPTTNLVYVADGTTGDTWVYNANLTFNSLVPSTFPPGSILNGITADPTSGTVLWSVFNGATNDLYAAPSVFAVPVFAGTLAIPTAGGIVLGIDCDNAITNIIYVNDATSGVTSIHDYFGTLLGAVCAAPFGSSFGISHRGTNWVELSADLTGVGAPTNFMPLDVTTCLPVDNVGIPFFAPGVVTLGFDYGPLMPAGTPTLYAFESASSQVVQVTVHRTFIRGDANSDGLFGLGDGIFILSFLFAAGAAPSCMDAADVNDDGQPVNISDALYVFSNLFQGGAAPPPPFGGCGHDPTADSLRCDASSAICP